MQIEELIKPLLEKGMTYEESLAYLKNCVEAETKNKKYKAYRIDLQPMRGKQSPHYTDHLLDYLKANMRVFASWNRLPIVITEVATGREIIIGLNSWWKWKENVKEWLDD